MGAREPALGLRDRKKIRTRETIRSEAMRLIVANGYANTTIEQIADAADIAPSTFFRYFPTKESVLMANDLDKVTVDALASPARRHAAPQGVSACARNHAGQRSRPPSGGFERARLRVVHVGTRTESRSVGRVQPHVGRLAEAEARRTGRDAGDLEIRVFVGALARGA